MRLKPSNAYYHIALNLILLWKFALLIYVWGSGGASYNNVIIRIQSQKQSLVEALALCIQMIAGALKEMISTKVPLNENDCLSLAQTCMDVFSAENRRMPTTWNKIAAGGGGAGGGGGGISHRRTNADPTLGDGTNQGQVPNLL